MLTWNVTYHCKKGLREEFYQELCNLGVRANSISEEGNCRYNYYFAAKTPDDLLLIETWTTSKLQHAHCQTDIFAQLQDLETKYCESVDIEKFNY